MDKAAIFDLDGTIWDASREVVVSWEKSLSRLLGKEYRITNEQMRSVMGLSMDEIAERLIPEPCGTLSRREAYEIIVKEENEYLIENPGRFFDGIEKAIRGIACIADVYILSNCQSGYIEAMLVNAPFKDCVKGTLCYGDTGLGKKDNIALLMKKYGITKAVYIGDTLGDEKATHGNGLPFIHAAYGYGVAECPEFVARNSDELPALAKAALVFRPG